MKNYAQLLESLQKGILEDAPAEGLLKQAERLAIYGHAYLTRLTDIIRGDYPALEAALGADIFARLVEEYIRETPSTFRDAQHYSEAFTDYITRKHNQLPPWAGDMARAERAEFRILNMQVLPAFRLPESGLEMEDLFALRLIPQPAAEYVESHYDLLAARPVPPEASKTCYAIFLNEENIMRLALEPDEAKALRLLDGGTMAEWLPLVLENVQAPPEKLQLWLARWMTKGLLCSAP